MNLTKRQQSAVIGMILGDGFLQATGAKNARLRLEQSIKQKDYLLWKAGLLPPLFQGKPVFLDRIHPKTKATYQYARQQSNASPVLGDLRKLFYPDGRKKIPDDLAKFLRDDVAFAIWFYDDGYYYQRDRCSYLYLGTVSRREAEVAQRAIIEKYGIASTVADKKQKGFALYFPRIESEKIKAILEKYPVPGMAYKIPLTP